MRPTGYAHPLISADLRRLVPDLLAAARAVGRPATITELARAARLPPGVVARIAEYATGSFEVVLTEGHHRRQVVHVRWHLRAHWPEYA